MPKEDKFPIGLSEVYFQPTINNQEDSDDDEPYGHFEENMNSLEESP